MKTPIERTNPNLPQSAQTNPIVPPTFRFPIVDPSTGILTTAGMQLLQQMFAALAGTGGLLNTQGSLQTQIIELSTETLALTGSFGNPTEIPGSNTDQLATEILALTKFAPVPNHNSEIEITLALTRVGH
jgi:hypothetical protein